MIIEKFVWPNISGNGVMTYRKLSLYKKSTRMLTKLLKINFLIKAGNSKRLAKNLLQII